MKLKSVKKVCLDSPTKPNKNKWISKYAFIEANSNFHESIRQILLTDNFWKQFTCYQEVPVIDLVPEYYSSGQRFDWYIVELNTVLELHGRQHYIATAFGSSSYKQKQTNFRDIQERDSDKQLAAEEAGYKYIAISYTLEKKLNGSLLKQLILQT